MEEATSDNSKVQKHEERNKTIIISEIRHQDSYRKKKAKLLINPLSVAIFHHTPLHMTALCLTLN